MAKKTGGKGGPTAARRKSRGLWAAVMLGLVGVGLVAFFIVRGQLTGGPRRADAEDIPAQDITSLPAGATGPEGQIVKAGAMDIQLEDPDNPKRLKGELHAAELEPQANHRYLVKAPEAWLYLKNGWMLYIRSETGSFFIPDNQKQPEKGVLQGAVRCEGYPPRADGTRLSRRSLDRSVEKPGMVATMDSMTFDSTLGTLSTDSRVVVSGEEMDFAGTGVKLVVNQVKEQLNALDVARGEYLKYRKKQATGATAVPKITSPSAPGVGTASPPVPSPAAGHSDDSRVVAGQGAAVGSKPAAAPDVTMYTAEFQHAVVVREAERSAQADQLDVWARLIDNALPEGAIVDLPTAADPEKEPAKPVATEGEKPAAPSRESTPTPAPAQQQGETPGEVTLTWSGPLRVRPLETEPAELNQDHVFMRMTAEQTGLVKLADPTQEMNGHCAGLEYGATSRRLVLSGPGPSSVVLAMKEFEAEAVRIEADLGLGTAKIPGPGVGRDKETGQRGSWAEQGDFEFRMERDAQTGKERVVGMKTAVLRGKTAMAAKDATVSADTMRAEFVQAGDEATSLDHVYVKGNVAAEVAGGRSLTCDEGDMAFKPGKKPRQPDPTSFTARGNVVAKEGPSLATAQSLHATLERGEDDHIAVTWVEMKGGAHFKQDDGVRPLVEADAEELTADPVKRIVDLIAADDGTARVVRGGAELTGRSIRLDGMANGAWEVGPGTFTNGPDKRSPEGPTVKASWTKEMKFDDTAGVLYAAGEVVADVAPDALSMDKIRAERVWIEMTPGRGPSEGDSALADAGAGARDAGAMGVDPSGGGRKLIRAKAEGAVLEEAGGANATVESWSYAADKTAPGGKRPERLLYLEGPLVLASDAEQTLDVQGEGRLLVVDRRYFDGEVHAPGAKDEDTGLGARLGQGSVGGSMFSWMGSMHLDRAAGDIHFLKRVRLNHKPQRDASLMELECEDLTAKIVERGAGAGADAKGVDGELESADAKGAVWGRSVARELVADRLFYDAKTGKAEAQASDGNRVTVFDRLKATTVTAAHILWDLNGDTIEVVDPGTVTAPK